MGLYKCWCGFDSNDISLRYSHHEEMSTPIELSNGYLRKVHQYELINADSFNIVLERLNEFKNFTEPLK